MGSGDSGSGAMTLGLPGDPDGIEELAHWLRGLADDLEKVAVLVRRLRDRSLESWWDPPGIVFATNLGSGASQMHRVADALRRLAGSLEDAARALRTAQARVDEAIRLARQVRLEITGGWVIAPPMLGDDSRWELSDYDRPDPVDYYNLQRDHYRQAIDLVESASELVVAELGALGARWEMDWTTVGFAAGHFAAGETGVLAREVEKKLRSNAEYHRSRVDFWSEQYRKAGGVSELQRLFAEHSGHHMPQWLQASYRAQNYGFVGRVLLRGSNPVIALGGLAWDIYANKTPVDKALFVTGVGFGAGALGAAGVIAIAGGGPPGWLVGGFAVAGGAVFGFIGATAASAFWDQQTRPSAREILLELT